MNMNSIQDLRDDDHVNNGSDFEEDDDFDDEEEACTFFDEMPAQDLYSERTFSSVEECLEYLAKTYSLDIKDIKKKFKLDCFELIKLVNFIRQTKTPSQDVLNILTTKGNERPWNAEKYLIPVMENDPLLMIDFEEDEEVEDGMFNMTGSQEKDEIDYLKGVIAKMSTFTQNLLNDDPKAERFFKDNQDQERENRKIDNEYAKSYAHFGIHQEMLSDKIRTEAYRDAICLNPETVKNKVVLDLGCGTGILSMFCGKAGSKKVIGVDMSNIIDDTKIIVRENGLENVITLVKGKLEEIALPCREFEVIVSEWMGYFLLYEGMLDSVIDARDKYLKKGGSILPNRCTMHLVAVNDETRHREVVEFWDDVYGFKMKCLKEKVIKEPSIEVIPSDMMISNVAQIHSLDMATCALKDTEFQSNFDLKISRDGYITSFAGYFDCFFDLPEKQISFTTGPSGAPTHWKQTLFYLGRKIKVAKGDCITGNIMVKRPDSDKRSLTVHISIDNFGVNEYEFE